MKPSKYNYILEDETGYIFFNGITESCFKISKHNFSAYEMIIKHPDNNYSDFKQFIDTMRLKGFIIDSDVIEDDLIRQKYNLKLKPQEYNIMILPTYQCNLRCWYCVQNHSDTWLCDEDIEKLKKRILRVLENEEIKNLHISWFGGEPLLAYDKIVNLSEWAIEICTNLKKGFTASITTNGLLLNNDMIEKLRKLQIKSYQITIDGDRKTHNKVKSWKNNSAFDTVIENIYKISRHTKCIMRLNYTSDNLKPMSIIKDIDSKLPKDNRNRISFLIYKVWQESDDKINENDVLLLANLAREQGINPVLSTCGMCYTDQKYFDCIFANGKVGKCDNADPEKLHVYGEIDKNGEIIWNGQNTSHHNVLDNIYESNECKDCKYLPICWGPCSLKRETMINMNGKISCQFNNKDAEMKRNIINMYLNSKI